MSIASVKSEMTRALKPTASGGVPTLTVAEARAVVRAAAKSGLTPGELKAVRDFMEKGVVRQPGVTPNCLAGGYVTSASARAVLFDFVQSHAPTPPAFKTVDVSIDDRGKTFRVREGEVVALNLPYLPGGGYQWSIEKTDRTFGEGQMKHIINHPDRVGALEAQEFLWKTDGGLPMLGKHTVTLKLARSWEHGVPPVDRFTFTVNIVP